MQVPARTRGIVLGLAVLILTPAVVVVGRTVPGVANASVRPSPVAAHVAGATVPVLEGRLRWMAPHDPDATGSVTHQPPKPAPAPAATPASRHIAPAVQAAPAAYGRQAIIDIILAAAARWGVSGSWMVSIAECESSLNPRAVGFVDHYGLFQFLWSTYTANGGTDIWDPAQQADITARMLAHGQAHQWACA